jgi:transposase
MVRTIGAEYVGVEFYRKLGMERILAELGLSQEQQRMAALLIVGRLVAPASERSTREWVRYRSGVSELLGSWVKGVSLSALYRGTDTLYSAKDRIEELLRGEEKRLFGLEEKIVLYDLTNTYFEGHRSGGPEVTYGKSKDKRNDCPLMTVGLVVDEWGFAKRSGFFPGNAKEPETLEQMLRELGAAADATVVVDAGIGIEKNLVALREAGFHYICVGRGKPLEEADDTDEGMVLIKARAENVVRGKLVKGQGEWILRCESSQRRVKEQAMKERFRQRFEEGLSQIRASLGKKRGIKSYEKVLERLGRLKERSHGIHRYYEITLIHDQRTVSEVRWNYSRATEADERYAGRYYIRTSRTDLDEKSLWQLYVTLGGIEDSFRSLKGELGLRPVFHSKSTRIKAHLFITVLAYHLLNAIRHRLREHGYLARWSTIRQRLSTHVMSTISLKTEKGTSINIRAASTPEVEQRDIYRALGLRLSPLPRRRSER